jgi:1,4-dihydroxy-2-naphthoate polyprenyltransferase
MRLPTRNHVVTNHITLNVLVILGHPRVPSLNSALADDYCSGARDSGANVERLNLGSIIFDPDVHEVSPANQLLEPDLEHAKKLIEWADHLTFIYPGWWGVGPARLKGFLDRILLPGFAFRERDDGSFESLLNGRTAHLITTLDMPPWVYRYIYRAPGHNAMKRSSLGFCGIETTRILTFGPVKDSSPEEREGWLQKSYDLGYSLHRGVRSRSGFILHKTAAWLRALRLQFYPMTWIAYSVGAFGAAAVTGIWDVWIYLVGFCFLFFLEAATVFTNEWFDYESDRNNQAYGPFSGGSRVLVDQVLTFRELARGIGLTLILTVACMVFLLYPAESPLPILLVMGAMITLALGYTVPPLKLSWRGLGELDVGLTHSLGAVLCGYLFLGGAWSDPFPWLVSIPLFLSVLPSIILAGVPDLNADKKAGKQTLAVLFGRKRAKQMALALTIAAVLAVILIKDFHVLGNAFSGLFYFAIPHALLLVFFLYRDQKGVQREGRIDRLMVLSLSFILWFGLIPLINLM